MEFLPLKTERAKGNYAMNIKQIEGELDETIGTFLCTLTQCKFVFTVR
ncbi:hypothetical protein SUT503_16040 [Streptococcus parasuis]|nr:hypothetical protein SUT503_16040 [Streptococcus parasuis]